MRKIAKIRVRPKLEVITPESPCVGMIPLLEGMIADIKGGRVDAAIVAYSSPDKISYYGSGDQIKRQGLAMRTIHRHNTAWAEWSG